MSDTLFSERRALLARIARLAGPNGVAGGAMSDGEAWIVCSRTIQNPDAVAPEPGPKDVMLLRVRDGVLYAELRDGTSIVVPSDAVSIDRSGPLT